MKTLAAVAQKREVLHHVWVIQRGEELAFLTRKCLEAGIVAIDQPLEDTPACEIPIQAR
jgi:hypothetical protein